MNYADAIARAERLLERALELGALRYGEFTLTHLAPNPLTTSTDGC